MLEGVLSWYGDRWAGLVAWWLGGWGGWGDGGDGGWGAGDGGVGWVCTVLYCRCGEVRWEWVGGGEEREGGEGGELERWEGIE